MPGNKINLRGVKEDIQHVLGHPQQGENLCNVPATSQADALAQAAAKKQKRRIRLRRIQKQKKKQRKLEAKKSTECKPKSVIKPEPTPPAPSEKHSQHIYLRKRHDATSILRTFDLLEKLCESRGGDKAALSRKLSQMRHVWERVQQESQEDATTRGTTKVDSLETQWDMVFFGTSTPLGKDKKSTFLERRSIWDSYISQSKKASSIPRGWVLPPEKPTPAWAVYRSQPLQATEPLDSSVIVKTEPQDD